MSTASTSLNFVCPRCLAVNRVPGDRRADHPVCGKCRATLLSPYPLDLTHDNFERFVTRTSLPVLVDFWAPWCGPCRAMAPQFISAAEQLFPDFILAKLNTEAEPTLASSWRIQGIPCLVLLQSGREVARQSGLMNAPQIAQWARDAYRNSAPRS